MKINEIISESASAPIRKTHKVGMQNALTSPDLNMSTGSAYRQYRFGIALAGSPEEPTPRDNYIAGDPLYAPYADEELEILQHAAKQIGIEFDNNWVSKKHELDSVNKQSPVKAAGPITLRNK